MHSLKIEGGVYTAVLITRSSPGAFGRLAAAKIEDGLRLEAGEEVEVTTPGVCMVELPDGKRHVAHITSGTIIGPAVLMQVDEDGPAGVVIDEVMVAAEQYRLKGWLPAAYEARERSSRLSLILTALATGAMSLTMVLAPGLMELTDFQASVALALGSTNFAFFLCLVWTIATSKFGSTAPA